MDWKPAGDTILLEKVQTESVLVLPDDAGQGAEDVYEVKAVGVGYVTEQGKIIPPEVKAGDKVLLFGKIVERGIGGEKLLIARAQDVICYKEAGGMR